MVSTIRNEIALIKDSLRLLTQRIKQLEEKSRRKRMDGLREIMRLEKIIEEQQKTIKKLENEDAVETV